MNFKYFSLIVESKKEVLTEKSMDDLIKIIEKSNRFSVKKIAGE